MKYIFCEFTLINYKRPQKKLQHIQVLELLLKFMYPILDFTGWKNQRPIDFVFLGVLDLGTRTRIRRVQDWSGLL